MKTLVYDYSQIDLFMLPSKLHRLDLSKYVTTTCTVLKYTITTSFQSQKYLNLMILNPIQLKNVTTITEQRKPRNIYI